MTKNFIIERKTTFIGERKIGFDSNFIIDILNNPFQFLPIFSQFSQHNVLYIHEESLREVPDRLNVKYGWDIKHAEKELEDFITKNNINIVKKDKKNPLLFSLTEKCKRLGIPVHPPDSWIIADFANEGINKVCSGDNTFLSAARVFNIDAQKTPTLDRRIKDQLREMKGFTKYRKGR